MTAALLELRSVRTRIGQTQVLHDVDLTVKEGNAVALLGPNGAGKTSLLRLVSRLLPCVSGDIRFRGESIARLKPSAMAGHGIAHVPQGRRCFGPLTVLENLRMGAYSNHQDVDAQLERVFGLLPEMLWEKRMALASELSGGQQQLLAIARGLMSAPSLLMLDEPTLGLAPIFVEQLKALLLRVRTEEKVGVLLVEQNVGMALSVCERINVIQGGRMVLRDRSSSDVTPTQIADLYMGAHLEAA